MIIGLCGLKGSGKDTVAAYIMKEHGFERRAFADPLKKSVAALLDIPFHEIEQMKNGTFTSVALMVNGQPKRIFPFRNFLQRYGTEAHRDIPEMGSDFWVDITLPNNGFYIGRKIVVTDCRFENEARRIKYQGGVIVEVTRPDADTLKDQHSSEVINFEIDYTIFNNGTVEELNERVELMLDRMLYSIEKRAERDRYDDGA